MLTQQQRERDALCRAVIDAPGDDAPRLILADWLDEHGEPGQARRLRLPGRWVLAGWWDRVTYVRLDYATDTEGERSVGQVYTRRRIACAGCGCEAPVGGSYHPHLPHRNDLVHVAGRGWLCAACLEAHS